MSDFPRILVAVDISPLDARSVEHAIRYAKADGWRVDVLYVSSGVASMPTHGLPAAVEILEDLRRSEEERAHRAMAALLETVPEALRGESHVRVGDAAKEISEAAHGYELLVIATHGRKGLQHMLLGSVTERVIRDAPCPVLVVR